MENKLKELRKAADMEQKDVAKIVGVTEAAISLWENGKRKPNIIMLKKLAKAFDVTTDELLEDVKV